MNDAITATPPQVELDKPVLEIEAPAFYVVSLKKFAILFAATFGLYQLYWFYKNWSLHKARAIAENGVDSDIWPVPRAIFTVFFVHSLFRAVDAYAESRQRAIGGKLERHATLLVALILLSNALTRLSNRSIGGALTDALSLLILLPLFYYSYRAQWFINASCGDPTGESNSKLTPANCAWIAVGVIYWLLVIVGLFLPAET